MLKKIVWLYAYVGFCDIVALSFHLDLLHLLCKPLLMPVLIYFYWLGSRDQMNGFHKLMIAAFFFSWLGDIALMFTEQFAQSFMLGLGSFLITHILYIIAFWKRDHTKEAHQYLIRRPYLATPFILYGFSLIYYLQGNLHEMLVPVIVYSTCLLFMTISAFNRRGHVNEASFFQVFIGAVLFLFSDSIIALNQFSELFSGNKKAATIAIMFLYILGQFLIANGALRKYALGLKFSKQ
jgi:uncharacterized membrane protein YhhN